jgi:hypothetical protein
MATLSELSGRLLAKFKNVPNITVEDAEQWVVEASFQYGYDSPDDVPTKETGLLLLLAQAEGARQIAVSTAHYFKWSDQGQQVDKANISDQYRKLSRDLIYEYERQRASGIGGTKGVNFRATRRLDR